MKRKLLLDFPVLKHYLQLFPVKKYHLHTFLEPPLQHSPGLSPSAILHFPPAMSDKAPQPSSPARIAPPSAPSTSISQKRRKTPRLGRDMSVFTAEMKI